ncbi:hypothetical protein Salat_1550900 [Sesamum alatum]|uniref:RNase H type-1 domain-containing protein n=1 Tax=Sesamum alatum TaxID=300844 RepID=A0AAE2CMY6_9LAMI|nr:hypothetical protein Salat_1550900 [Sesamum alatum]
MEPEAIVAVLINESGLGWKVELIQEVFFQEEADIILAFPLGRTVQDRLIWHRSRKGEFSVRSAYNLQRDLETLEQESTSVAPSDDNWNKDLMENVKEEPISIIHKATSYLSSFKSSNWKPSLDSRRIQATRWRPPDPTMIKINFDGAIFKNLQGAGAGSITRDTNGHCQGWTTRFFRGVRGIFLSLPHYQRYPIFTAFIRICSGCVYQKGRQCACSLAS